MGILGRKRCWSDTDCRLERWKVFWMVLWRWACRRYSSGIFCGYAEQQDRKSGISDRVYISKTQYFDNVPQAQWEQYIGGYQPLQKWLKDRKKTMLSTEDIEHYKKIIAALRLTEELMAEIDQVVEFWYDVKRTDASLVEVSVHSFDCYWHFSK